MPGVPSLPAYCLDVLLPLCRDRFADPVHGGFFERLDASRQPLPLGTKRLMVQCRQLYVLSHAALLGETSGAGAAMRGYDFLRRAYRDTAEGGWFFRVTDAGAPADRRKDLYAHAFLIFALAWLHRAFAVADAEALASETLAVLRARLAAPDGGFWDAAEADWTPDTSVRRQNPHMHLLEAVLAWHAATGDARWLEAAGELVGLFARHFFDAPTATLGEHFDAAWRPHPEQGGIVEPGHHFEWVWLLDEWRRQSGDTSQDAAAEALFATAMRHGFDPVHGGIHDQIDRSGAPLATTRRIWPVTEAIKAHVARVAAGRPVGAGQPEGLVRHLFDHFLLPATGGWAETLTREGRATQTALPGSTPYHVFLAGAELLRLR